MLIRSDPGTLTVFFEGRPIPARPGDSIAAALLANDIRITRGTSVSGAPRGPYCMMGACFDCLAVVDGTHGVQTCLEPVRRRHARRAPARRAQLASADVP